jgi:dihydroorotase
MTSTADTLLADARVHLPNGETIEGWIATRDGRISAIGSGSTPSAHTVFDVGGNDVIPGVVDIHVHFRDPGDTRKEDFSTGTLSAAFGGVTTIVDMPNTGRQVTTAEDFREKLDHVAGRAWVDYGLHALFADSAPHVKELCELGVAGLKWMMGYAEWKGMRDIPSSNAEARKSLIAAAEAGLLVGVHAESLPWLNDLRESLRPEGRTDVGVHPDSRPPFVETIAVAEAVILAAEFGCRMHVYHLTADMPLRAATALRDALGAHLTLETCPSYLFLSHEDVEEQGVAIQVNPPMRPLSDQVAMWNAIATGEIYNVASDHAPALPENKECESPLDALPGVVIVETMLPLMLDAVARGRLTLERMIELLCAHPAQLVRLDHRKGSLVPGHDADLVVLDLEGSSQVKGEELHSKMKFTPYEGRECKGAISAVFLRGQPLIQNRRLVAETPSGLHVPSNYTQSTRVAHRATVTVP